MNTWAKPAHIIENLWTPEQYTYKYKSLKTNDNLSKICTNNREPMKTWATPVKIIENKWKPKDNIHNSLKTTLNIKGKHTEITDN